VRFHRRELDRLVLADVEAVQVARKICSGTAIAANTTARRNILLRPSTCTPRRRYHATTPPITKQVVRNAASTMCASRYGNDGVEDDRPPAVGLEHAVRIEDVARGVCIQLLAAMIQNVEISVPSATMQVAKKCSFACTRLSRTASRRGRSPRGRTR
jgi:hypothetical protein